MSRESTLSATARAVMLAHLANLAPGEQVAADDLTPALTAAGAAPWERSQVWRWAAAQGLIERLAITVVGLTYSATRPSRDPAAGGRHIAVYARTSKPTIYARD